MGMGTSAGTLNDKELLYIPVPNVTKSGLSKTGNAKISLNEEDIVLIHHKGKVHAVQENCPHQGGPLHLGEIEELPDKSTCIKCPWHSWKFNITTGECIFPGHKLERKLSVYPVQLNKEEIRLGFPKISTKYFQTPPP